MIKEVKRAREHFRKPLPKASVRFVKASTLDEKKKDIQ